MDTITIEHNPSTAKLEVMGIYDWPIWQKAVSVFPWHYDNQETCYLLEGEVTIITETGNTVKLTEGDLVNFPKGLSCTWEIHKTVKKHYRFS